MKTALVGSILLTLILNNVASANEKTSGNIQVFAEESEATSPETVKDGKYLRRLKRTAVSALTMTVVNSGLHVASDIMFFYSHSTPGTAMSLTGFGLTVGLTTVFYLSNRSAYRHFGTGGNTALQTWGLIASGLAVADALAVMALGFAAGIPPRYGMISIAGLFSAIGFTLLAIDGLHARKQVRKRLASGESKRPSPVFSPFISEIASAERRGHGAVLGIAGRF